MNRLIDTNVVSEYRKPRPNAAVIAFLRRLEPGSAYLSVVTLSEIRMGIERMPTGPGRERLETWIERELPLQFQESILGIDQAIAHACGVIRARAFDAGRPMAVMDAFLAATADIHGLQVVTRNVKDFEIWGGPVLNPWGD